MDKKEKPNYTKDKHETDRVDQEVISMAPATAQVRKPTQKKKLAKSAAELRKMIATRSAFGEKLVDLYKEGK